MDVCTIVGHRDVAAARVTIDTLRAVHPDATVHVLDIDGVLSTWSDCYILTPDEIGVPDADLHPAAMLADSPGLSRWLLPRLLQRRAVAGTAVVYLAPGTRVLGSLDGLVAAAERTGVGVIARRDDLPQDVDLRPSADDLTTAGPFHDCALAVGPAALDLLESWIDLSEPGRRTPWQTAVEVRRHEVLPSAALLSRWNIQPGSRIDDSGGSWTCDGHVSVIADLVEFDPVRPWMLSTTDRDAARARLSDHPALQRLCTAHAADLADAAVGGEPDASARFGSTAAGIVVHSALRTAYRLSIRAARSGLEAAPPDPFDALAPGAFTEWLDEVVSDKGVPITRYLRGIYDDRPDLRLRFPHVPGEDAALLVDWAERHARHEDAYADRLVDSAVRVAVNAAPTTAPRARRRPPGLNVVGYLHGELGIGESARLMLAALRTTRVPYATRSVERHLQSRQGTSIGSLGGADETFDMTLLCVNADQIGAVLDAEPDLEHSTYRIGMWYWEAEDLPPTMHGGFGHVDEVWVATDFIREAVRRHTALPVLTMTPPLSRPATRSDLTRADLGLPDDRPVLLFMFDYLSTAERKNPVGLINAFRRAFSPGEGPILVIKSINSDKRIGDAERVRLRAAGEPDVILLDDYLSAEGRDTLLRECTAYVSLHRSEGLGLTLAEAMSLGKPVIATGYSGNLQFMTPENSFLVAWAPTAIPENCEPYPAGSTWAEPDLDDAARLMRLVIDDPAIAAARGARGAFDIRELHAPAIAGRRIAERLVEIRHEITLVPWRSRARRLRSLVRPVA